MSLQRSLSFEGYFLITPREYCKVNFGWDKEIDAWDVK
jgi:hypothetical protein